MNLQSLKSYIKGDLLEGMTIELLFCIESVEFCTKGVRFCIQNAGFFRRKRLLFGEGAVQSRRDQGAFCIKSHGFCVKNDEFSLNMMDSVLKMMNFH